MRRPAMHQGFCLDCRTLLGTDQECDLASFHRVVDLGDEAGREAARCHVWGPPSVRQRAATGAKAGAVAALLQGAIDGCSACSVVDALGSGLEGLAILGVVLLGMLLVFAVVALLVWGGLWLYDRFVEWRGRLRPRGVRLTSRGRARAGRARVREVLRGRIEAGGTGAAPVGDARAVGWGLRIESSEATVGRTIAQAGRSFGFRVALDDGRTLDVPPGRIRVHVEDGPSVLGAREIQPWLREMDGRSAEEKFPALPGDRGQLRLLEVGDHVVLEADTEAIAGGDASYRSAALRLGVRGVASVR